MKIPNNIDYDRYQWENVIDRWIFNEEHRAMLKRNLLDGRTYEQLAEEFDRAVYSSTENEQERNIYFDMLDKLNKR